MPSVSFYPVLEKRNCWIDKCLSWPWSSSALVFLVEWWCGARVQWVWEVVGRVQFSRNGSNINFYPWGLSVFAASVEMVFGLGSVSLPGAGLMLAGICLGCAAHCVQRCFTFSLCRSRWEAPQRGPGHPISRLISARHRSVATRDGLNLLTQKGKSLWEQEKLHPSTHTVVQSLALGLISVFFSFSFRWTLFLQGPKFPSNRQKKSKHL